MPCHARCPAVLHVGSLRQVAPQLGLNTSGRQQEHLKSAFHQNASAYIVTKLRYRDRDGRQRRLEAGFTRYSVVFQGERLPDGTPADAVYLVLSEPYREILNHAPVRPLDYAYLQALTPMAQRFYELLSYHIFATLTHRRPHATLRYGEYCLLATQQRYTGLRAGQKTDVQSPPAAPGGGLPCPGPVDAPRPTPTASPTGSCTTPPAPKRVPSTPRFGASPAGRRRGPGPRTRSRPTSWPSCCRRRPRARRPPPTPPHPQAEALVQQFYQRFHGRAQVTPTAKELTQATALLTTHGREKAQYLLTFSHQAAQATRYDPQVFGGILHYTDRALAAYDARAAQGTHATTRQAAADERTQREQYQAWEQRQLAQRRTALPPAGAGGARSGGARPARGGGHARGRAAAGRAGGGRPGAGGAGRAAVLRGLAADAGGMLMHPGASDDTHAHGARKRPAWTTRLGGRAPRARGTRSSCVLGGLVVVAVVSTRWVRLNLSPSRPSGLYRLTAIRAPLTRGTLVVLPVPACVRPWQAAWVPRRTPIAGVAGDGVCQTDHTRYVKGADCGVVSPTAHVQAVPPLPVDGQVGPEEPAVAQPYAVLALQGHAARACETQVGVGDQAHGTARRRQRVP